MACSNAGLLVSTPEPFAIASIVNWPVALGSGKLMTPFERMHCENFTACSRFVSVLPVLPVPVAAGAFEPHALIMGTMAIRARPASGRSFLLVTAASSP
jgi:hypothetical protein